MTVELDGLATETRNEASAEIDEMTADEIVRVIHAEDMKAADAVTPALPKIAKAIGIIANRLSRGGRLIYVGAGTSGRLGVLDAAECLPTFNAKNVTGIIAGGRDAMFRAAEGAEDDSEGGARALMELGLTDRDIVTGIAASGRTPFVIGALKYARDVGAATIAVVCAAGSPVAARADVAIEAPTGAEVITGSTRMKAGTVQKMILNMLSTGAMILLGKVYKNLMVDLVATNEKLKERSKRIVMEAADCSRAEAERALKESGGRAKIAILMILAGISAEEARGAIESASGHLRAAIRERTNQEVAKCH